MLQMDPIKRFSLQQIKNHVFYQCIPIRSGDFIPVPIKNGDKLRCSTVLPYLENYHYDTDRDDRSVEYLTDHQLQLDG